MKILIDADGCPVIDITIKYAKKFDLACKLICDTSHFFEREGAETITVSKGDDSADFALVNLIQNGDIVVTQDYGLAAMCLAKGANAVNQNGIVYNDDNILPMLNQRYTAKKIRMAGGRTKGSPKRTKQQDDEFEIALLSLLENK